MKGSLFGKDKKKIRIDCSDKTSKVFLIRQARKRKPGGIYASEFLSPGKLRIFYNLRQLKSQHSDKIQSVFTRGGHIFYRLKDSDREVRVNSLSDLTRIVVVDASAEVSGAEGGGS